MLGGGVLGCIVVAGAAGVAGVAGGVAGVAPTGGGAGAVTTGGVVLGGGVTGGAGVPTPSEGELAVVDEVVPSTQAESARSEMAVDPPRRNQLEEHRMGAPLPRPLREGNRARSCQQESRDIQGRQRGWWGSLVASRSEPW